MRTGFVSSVGLAAFVALGAVGTVKAEPDMRDIPPFVMIVADTSGSMEWQPGCSCTTDCTTCYPDCSASNDSTGKPPPEKKNRWAMLVESLTGAFTDFQCAPLPRTDPAHFTYDFGYSKPFHRPWLCPGGETFCDYPGTPTSPIQVQNGLLDNYGSRIRFGLATFDGVRTYSGASDLVTSFNPTLSNGAEGMYSYGGVKPVRYPTCSQTHLIDSGIRSPAAPEGGLISLNAPLCANPPCDPQLVNKAIQDTLLKTRTFGGTPTGSALDDLYFHFKTEMKPSDSMAECRQRFAILITDGNADDDFREYPVPGCACNSPTRNNCPDPTLEDPNLNVCPYPTADQAAYDLVNGRAEDVGGVLVQDEKQIEKLYVVGMSIADADSRKGLDLIASKGGTGQAFYADDPSTLTATLDDLLGKMTSPISRSVPAFASTIEGNQYQVSSGFDISPATVPPGFAPPWFGILERRRYVCSKGDLSSPTLTDEDKFHVQLNKQDADDRRLWTALPGNPTPTNIKGLLNRDPLVSDSCGTTGCIATQLKDVKPTNLFGSIDDTRKGVVLDWMYGRTGSLREKYKLGDIYHSSPAIVGAPTDDPGDQSYTLFRGSTLITQRPSVLYVNSNDGILHAFLLEDHQVGADDRKAGYELWGFVPPNLIGKLDSQLSAHSLNLDGTPVVKDVYFSKSSSPSATDYKTVLVTGMRAGGQGYVALDVTDPVNPKFLWQFTAPEMGYTYGLPEIVQARYSLSSSTPAGLRAMVILSGGKGELDPNAAGCDNTLHIMPAMMVGPGKTYTTYPEPDLSKSPFTHRTAVRCWKPQGRALYFVDVETGILIKKIADNSTAGVVFPSPVVGSPTAYQDSVGTVATEGFVLDADGVLWRIDLTADDPRKDDPLTGWTVRPFHDLFWDVQPADGETTYERPILSLDDKHQLVVIVGTGDTDNFEKATAMNRVVSLTEMVKTPTPSVPTDYVAGLNWEMRADAGDSNGKNGFVPSELVTGTMALVSQQLFFASFISRSDTTNPCATGLGRLWSVHYTERDEKTYKNATYATTGGSIATYGPRRIAVAATGATTTEQAQNADTSKFNIEKSAAEENLLVLGLGSTQRPTCDDFKQINLNNYYSPAGTLQSITQTKTPSIWIVAQASDAKSKDDDSARKRAGSALGTLEVKLDRPLEFSQVSSWAGSIE
ncbi:MAG TPA: PilC/PilY family type IV pilus protein [Polyangiales bacterium]|nr:PilC/PilY family type IV pilus protein [Polyangiales bacterium]